MPRDFQNLLELVERQTGDVFVELYEDLIGESTRDLVCFSDKSDATYLFGFHD